MASRGTPRRTRKRWSFGVKTARFAVHASHTADQWFRDGEDSNSTGVVPAVNTVNSLLIGSYGDFDLSQGSSSGWNKASPLIKRIIFNAHLNPTETNNQVGAITFQWWFMLAPTVVNSDWVLNSRDPNDNGLFGTAAAYPHVLLKTGLAHFRTSDVSTQLAMVGQRCAIKADLKYAKGLKLMYPNNIYFMIKPIIENDSAGAWASGEVAITWNVAVKAACRISG